MVGPHCLTACTIKDRLMLAIKFTRGPLCFNHWGTETKRFLFIVDKHRDTITLLSHHHLKCTQFFCVYFKLQRFRHCVHTYIWRELRMTSDTLICFTEHPHVTKHLATLLDMWILRTNCTSNSVRNLKRVLWPTPALIWIIPMGWVLCLADIYFLT
jgi:hypothetical protein